MSERSGRMPACPSPVRQQRPFADNLPHPPQRPAGVPEPTYGRLPFPEGGPDAGLLDALGADRAIRDGVLPWRRAGAVTIVGATSPSQAERKRGALEALFGPVALAETSFADIESAVLAIRRGCLASRAEERTDEALSCRGIGQGRLPYVLAAAAAFTALALLLAPATVAGVLVFWAAGWLLASTLLRLAAAFAAEPDRPPPPALPPDGLPTISCLVPVFRERDIAGHLIDRLSRLDYPPDKLEICLIVEKRDVITRAAITRADLPRSMRLIVVPPGNLQTKPRALNYALDFTSGDIVGIYDAEDAPAFDQLRVVAERFATAGRDVACLQGRLDFYNPRTNWLARCFAIDYAVWFRVILPGLSRLGLPVPLGGTTLFFRRDVLNRLGGWDAHNVTEDADLGLRLSRMGWRTELIPTVTEEEANCRLWPWIRQRSRWIKGYAMTWAVHMQRPRTLLSDLGLWGFVGFQIVFLGSLSQFVLAPFLWSFWLVLFGAPHPVASALPHGVIVALATLFLAAEVGNVALGAWACRGPRHRWLIPWVPTMHFYFPLAAVASWKGLAEIVSRPFFWDKTEHGEHGTDMVPET
ncbi:MAG: glycosyltransferase [Paracoccaceae bacterium]|nr:glycosyltransferase [Paracoccaceae bacterium]